VRILYLNHTGRMSGAERSLLELLSALPDEVARSVASPPGPFAAAAREQDESVAIVPPAEGSLRLDPARTPLAVGGIVRAAFAVARLARRERADLIHANSIRAGLVARAARRLGAPPAVVYVHDCLPDSWVANATRRAIHSADSIVLANSHYTAANFGGRQHRGEVRTSYNGMIDDRGELVSLHGRGVPSRPESRSRFDVPGPLIGVVAQITPWKGQDTAIEALAIMRREHPDARLLLVGETKFLGKDTRFDNRAYLAGLRRRVAELGIADGVDFLGERDDALEIIAALDVLLAPSWEEPFGRTIVEAMVVGTPVVATAVGGPAEIIEDGVSGRLVAPRDPELLADALLELLANPGQRDRIAREGRSAARRFRLADHKDTVVSAYGAAVASHT
jgi:glycosyltransferase involved in cell wall biosynthesis